MTFLKSRSHPRHQTHAQRRTMIGGSGAFRPLLAVNNFRQSMPARANPYHNALTESFMGTLITEMLQGGTLIDAHDTRMEILSYLEACDNTRR